MLKLEAHGTTHIDVTTPTGLQYVIECFPDGLFYVSVRFGNLDIFTDGLESIEAALVVIEKDFEDLQASGLGSLNTLACHQNGPFLTLSTFSCESLMGPPDHLKRHQFGYAKETFQPSPCE
jgi:hypothetical protein